MMTENFGDSSIWFGGNSSSSSYMYGTAAPPLQNGETPLLAGSLNSSMPSTPSSYLTTLNKAAGLDLSMGFPSPFPYFTHSLEPYDTAAPPASNQPTFAASPMTEVFSRPGNEHQLASMNMPPSSPPSFFSFGSSYSSTPLPTATSSHSATSLSNRLAHYHPSPGIFDPPELFPSSSYPFSFSLGSPVPSSVPASPSLLSAPAAASSSPARVSLPPLDDQPRSSSMMNQTESAEAMYLLSSLSGPAKHDRSTHIGMSSPPPIASASSSASASVLSASSNPLRKERAPPAKRPKRPRPFDSLAVMNRDHFQNIVARLGTSEYDGYRIYPDPEIGYSGNARIFKPYPEDNERALLLSCQITVTEDDGGEAVVHQCPDCISYYEMKKYFRASPTAKGRALHVRNSKIIKVENGELLISARVMCSSAHHRGQPFNLTWGLIDHRSGKTILSGQIAVIAKQWKRSREPVSELGFDFSAPL